MQWYTLLFIFFALNCCKNKNQQNFKINHKATFFRVLTKEPENLHPIKGTDVSSYTIYQYVLESLLQHNKDNYQLESRLAKTWEISPDGKIFTFTLHDNLKWSDGKPLTTKDVKFSFEAYSTPAYGGIRHISYYENLNSAKIVSDKKIQFTVKDIYFDNFAVIGRMPILPRHIYKDPHTKMSKQVIGSGPYKISHYIKGKMIVLTKNPFWEGKNHSINKNRWQFQNIVFRFVETQADTLLRMEKRQLDFIPLSAKSFMEKTLSPPWGTEIKKVQYENKESSSLSYIGLNLKNPQFQDPNVRLALAHLLNRRFINEKFNHNTYELARGPWHFWSEYADPTVKPIEFNPKRAIKLLQSAGWKDKDKNGILEKNMQGKIKEFDFTLLFSNPEGEKILTLYKQDLKQVGIRLRLKRLDWTSFLRLVREKNFHAMLMAWGKGAIDIDPKGIWHSHSAVKGGANYISYSNPQVDRLIDIGRTQLNRKQRIKTFQKVYRLIAKDVPYIFLFNYKKRFYAVNKRIHTPTHTFNYDLGISYWSLKESP